MTRRHALLACALAAACGRDGSRPASRPDAGAAASGPTVPLYRDKEIPRPVMTRLQGIVAACHRDARAKQPELRGAVELEVEVYAMGTIASVEATPREPAMAGVAECSQRVIEQMVLAPAPGPYGVELEVRVAPPPRPK